MSSSEARQRSRMFRSPFGVVSGTACTFNGNGSGGAFVADTVRREIRP